MHLQIEFWGEKEKKKYYISKSKIKAETILPAKHLTTIQS